MLHSGAQEKRSVELIRLACIFSSNPDFTLESIQNLTEEQQLKAALEASMKVIRHKCSHKL